MPDSPQPHGLVAYDLMPPPRLIFPGRPHDRAERHRNITVGDDDQSCTVECLSWDACRPGCASPVGAHDAGYTVAVRMECSDRPHCRACECDSGHTVRLSPGDVAAIVGMLADAERKTTRRLPP